jgi:release factor glutamine methyltransferase
MRIASNKINDIIRFFREELKDIYEKEELEIIIGYCFEEYLDIKRSELILKGNETLSESELLKFNFAVKELKTHKPIQYVLGKSDFYGLKFKVNEHVLIPRPETEELVDLIIKEFQVSDFKSQISILDIGTGSGCIPIALKKNLTNTSIYALDISRDALEVAQQNAKMNEVEVDFVLDDILNPKSLILNPDSLFDIIVSNPPYVRISEKEEMQKNVLDHEPHLALFVSDNDPLLFYKAIADFAIKKLNPDGKIYFEINYMYGEELKQLLESKGFKNVLLLKDINNKNRILRGTI